MCNDGVKKKIFFIDLTLGSLPGWVSAFIKSNFILMDTTNPDTPSSYTNFSAVLTAQKCRYRFVFSKLETAHPPALEIRGQGLSMSWVVLYRQLIKNWNRGPKNTSYFRKKIKISSY